MKTYLSDRDFTLYQGDAYSTLSTFETGSIDCVVTSPPYYGLRDYGADDQIGLEPTIGDYVTRLLGVFSQIKRVLKNEGTVWLNLGDSYVSSEAAQVRDNKAVHGSVVRPPTNGMREKNLMGVPWRVAFALQDDGWYLRSDIIWSKPNPMPESITDRPTKSHEYIFLLTKSKDYFFDQDAVREPYSPVSEDRYRYAFGGKKAEALLEADKHGVGRRTSLIGHKDFPAKQDTLSPELPPEADRGPDGRRKTTVKGADGSVQHRDGERWGHQGRNIRSVWYLPTQATPDAHFATFPEKIPERCIKAGCPERGVVLDPFMGSGTTAIVARRLGRKCVGVELNPEYCALIERRTNQLSLLA